MHGIFRFSDIDTQIDQEQKLLQPAFQKLILQSSQVVHRQQQELIKFLMAPPDEVGEADNPDNFDIPAGYTYLGQLISHDLSCHRFLGNARPSLRLRTLYGMGPGFAPYLYEYKPLQHAGLRFRGVKFTLDTYESAFGNTVYDIPRHNLKPDQYSPQRQNCIPLMADARNDQNFIISQLTVKFAQVHNFLVDMFQDPAQEQQGGLFERAADVLIALYQSIVLNDYLPKILYKSDIDILKDIENQNFIFYTGAKGEAQLSEIFTRAIFRFGHAMVRPIYHVYPNQEAFPIFGADLDLRGFVRDTRRAIDWSLFFGKDNNGKAEQPSKKIGHMVSIPMSKLPFLRTEKNNLIQINLENSERFLDGMECYKTYYHIVKAAGKAPEPTPDELQTKINEILPAALQNEPIPLWLFILLEAEVVANGESLGPMGSRIVAEQIMWILMDDDKSILNPDVKKTLTKLGFPSKTTMQNLLEWVTPQHEADTSKTERTANLPLEMGEQVYQGDELHIVNTPADFKVYTDSVNSFVKRNQIIKKEFYDIETPRTADYVQQILNGTYHEPLNRARQQIRVYVSLRSILYNLGHSGMATLSDDEKTRIENKDIKGLLFIFGLANGSLQATVKRVGKFGEAPPASAKNLVYFTDTAQLIEINNTVPGKQAHEHYAKLTGDFIKDGFITLKSVGLDTPFVINRDYLLSLLAEDTNTAPMPVEKVEFHLSSALGSEILATHGLPLPLGWPTEHVPNSRFINLALKSTMPDGVKLMSENTRPYPYWCYNT